MALELNSLQPAAAAPGDEIFLLGAGFSAGLAVRFLVGGVEEIVSAVLVLSDTQAQVVVPELTGTASTAQVSVTTALDESRSLPLAVLPSVDALPPRLLCTVEHVRRLLNLAPGETAEDSRYAALIPIASAQIMRHTRRRFRVEPVANERHDGDGTDTLYPRHTPLVSVTALEVDGAAMDVAEVEVSGDRIRFVGGDYSARTRSSGRSFPEGVGNVSVSYLAGHSRIPDDIVRACALQVIHLVNTATKQGILNENNPQTQLNVGYSQEALAPAVAAIANSYRPARVRAI